MTLEAAIDESRSLEVVGNIGSSIIEAPKAAEQCGQRLPSMLGRVIASRSVKCRWLCAMLGAHQPERTRYIMDRG